MGGQIDLRNWMDSPHNRWSFKHVSEIIPTVPILNRSGYTNVLPRLDIDLENVSFVAADGSKTNLS
ncbi:MAG: hypothetical protein ACKO2E_07240, partial [Actinomycetota bacterium]